MTMNEKRIKVVAGFAGLEFEVFVTVSQDAWDSEMDSVEEDVRGDIKDCEFFGEYDANEYESPQDHLVSHLVFCCPYRFILKHLGVFEQLRDAMIEDLIESDTEHQYEHVLQMLKEITDCERVMIAPFDDDEEDVEYITICNEYPSEMLDELAKRIDGVSK